MRREESPVAELLEYLPLIQGLPSFTWRSTARIASIGTSIIYWVTHAS